MWLIEIEYKKQMKKCKYKLPNVMINQPQKSLH